MERRLRGREMVVWKRRRSLPAGLVGREGDFPPLFFLLRRKKSPETQKSALLPPLFFFFPRSHSLEACAASNVVLVHIPTTTVRTYRIPKFQSPQTFSRHSFSWKKAFGRASSHSLSSFLSFLCSFLPFGLKRAATLPLSAPTQTLYLYGR